jgi:hypothetical protein
LALPVIGKWRAEEEARKVAGPPDPYTDVDYKGKDFIWACIPKKLKPGATKFNEPHFEAVEKAIIEKAKNKDQIKICRGHDVLTEALGTPEHRGRARGVGSKVS